MLMDEIIHFQKATKQHTRLLVALVTSEDLFLSAKDLFFAAKSATTASVGVS
jgi:hypothetical protein